MARYLGGSMKFILTVLVYWTPGSGASSMTSVEYNTPQACEAAKSAAVQTFTVGNLRTVATCTAKG